MARGPEETGRRGEATEYSGREEEREQQPVSTVEAIHELAKRNARAPLHTEEQLMLYLKSWWSKTYNRPLKDPLLQEYTFEELLYEFYDRVERNKAEKEVSEQADDTIDQDKLKHNLDWAEQEEKRELEELKKKQQEEQNDPAKDPENQKWMQEQIEKEIEKGKELFGSDFGEEIDFEDS